MGEPAWASDSKFSTLTGRIGHQVELDRGVESWTLTLDKYELMERCQELGVRAMPVQSSEDRVEHDPQLRVRGMYSDLEHPALGPWKFQNAPFRLSKTPARNSRPTPLIGQHNTEVFQDLLGFTDQDVRDSYREGVFWPREMPMFPYVKEAIP